ncbi:hypothetical protein [Embleya scabrispora]|uniref:hypothetical protein n=1 Tax=Embleya scabrispora TaxID=159449 RepID=UPI001319D8B1|nr:hypothetical protein [Embleya scabrispora]MYS82002.1 hypothetical protein [Streptomyces sp. SID5474]
MKSSIRRTRHALPRGEAEVWAPVSARYGIPPYGCKYLYTAGALREFIASAGLLVSHGQYLAAASLSLNGAELVGRCVSERTEQGVTQRLRNGLAYLENLETAEEGELVPEVDALVKLRGFTAHPTLEPPAGSELQFSHGTFEYLLDRLALAADRLWTDADASVVRKFSGAKIAPMRTDGKNLYVEALLAHLDAGHTPGTRIPYEESWRVRSATAAGR